MLIWPQLFWPHLFHPNYDSNGDVWHRDASDTEIDHGSRAIAIENCANLACGLSENCNWIALLNWNRGGETKVAIDRHHGCVGVVVLHNKLIAIAESNDCARDGACQNGLWIWVVATSYQECERCDCKRNFDGVHVFFQGDWPVVDVKFDAIHACSTGACFCFQTTIFQKLLECLPFL